MQSDQTAIPCHVIRGGTSRGLYFLSSDLPKDQGLRDEILLSVIGGPDALQIDGLGGGHPLTCKVALVSPSARDDADLDFLFLQVMPTEQKVTSLQNCGNILAGVGPFALESGLMKASGDETIIRVCMLNSQSIAHLTISTPGGTLTYHGSTSIDGVPGTHAALITDFLDIAGSATGAILPTGNVQDSFNGVAATCVDNGMPVVVLRAADFGLSGYEAPEALDADDDLKAALEAIRLQAGAAMSLGDVSSKTIPKTCLVAPPQHSGLIATRTFIPHVCHRSIGVLGAVSVATSCMISGSVAHDISRIPEGAEKTLGIEHPTGALTVRLLTGDSANPSDLVRRVGIVRTARSIMQGQVFVNRQIWDGK